MRAPEKLVVDVWQASHGCDVVTCPAGFPVAVLPSWHEAQPVVTPSCVKLAPANVVVDLWQLSHGALVAIWPEDLPVAVLPLWHEAHPDVIPE